VRDGARKHASERQVQAQATPRLAAVEEVAEEEEEEEEGGGRGTR
jgi:hypothetical protein